LPAEIYTRIEALVQEGRDKGLSNDEISKWVSQQLEQEISGIFQRLEKIKPSLSRSELEKLIGPDLTAAMTEMVDIASTDLDLDGDQLFFYLAIHLYTVIERIRHGQLIVNPQLSQVKKNHEQEYLVAVKMAAVVRRHLGLTLPEDEIGFIALYLRTFLKSNKVYQGRVAVLVLSHGRVAQEMVNVVHALLRENHVHSLDMSLMESPEDFLQRVLVKAREIDQGKGIMLLVDMGSLVTFGELIEQELGIPVRVVDRVDLVMVLEATRWSALADARLEDIAKDLVLSKSTPLVEREKKRRQIIVSVCLSGVGGAEKIRAFLESRLGDFDVEIKSIGVIDEDRLRRKLEEWQKNSHIAAIVGTINPEIPGIPFIPFQTLTSSLGMEYLGTLLRQRKVNRLPSQRIVTEDMIVAKAEWRDKATIISNLGEILLQRGYVSPGYIQSIFEREEFAPTCIEGGIAIPHADPQYVLKPGIAVATLAQPINWWGLEVDVVFLLALRVSDRQLFANLMKVFRDKEKMQKIRSVQTGAAIGEEIINVIEAT
jgi:transcriptional regulatory protein LevR